MLAEANQTNQLFELALITGGKGAYFPLHCHEHLFETIFVLEGKLEVMLDGKNTWSQPLIIFISRPKRFMATECIVIKQDLFHIRWAEK